MTFKNTPLYRFLSRHSSLLFTVVLSFLLIHDGILTYGEVVTSIFIGAGIAIVAILYDDKKKSFKIGE
jgi:O-antigen/teichoic acid export membrane protein